MFGSSLAQEAKDMAADTKARHESHVQTCLENQRRIESRFTGVETKLDKQDDAFDRFKDEITDRLDAIKENDSKRYIAMMTLIVTTVVGIAIQIVFYFKGIKV